MQLSTHFNRAEFKCSCCDFDTVDSQLIGVLEEVREHFKTSIKINSAARCLKYNRLIGSTDSSQHTKGRAADIVVQNVSSRDVFNYLDSKYPNKLGLGRYSTFTHIDTRNGKARWGL